QALPRPARQAEAPRLGRHGAAPMKRARIALLLSALALAGGSCVRGEAAPATTRTPASSPVAAAPSPTAPPAPTAGPARPPPVAEKQAIETLREATERTRGLRFDREVRIEIRDERSIVDHIARDIEDEELAKGQALYTALGLLPPGMDLVAELRDVLG